MRHLILIALVWLAWPVTVLAKPTLAIAPIDGDRDDEIADAIADAIAEDAKVVRGKKVDRALAALDISGRLSLKDVKKLAKKLDADVVVHGKVEKDGKARTLELRVTHRGKKPVKVEIAFKSARASKFKKELRDELRRRLGEAGDAGGDDEGDDDGDRKRKKLTERDDDDKRGKKRRRDDDDDRKRKRIAERDDDDDRSKRRKKRRDDDDDRDDDDRDDDERDDDERDDDDRDGPGVAARRHPATQVALRIHAGGAFGRRSLTYTTTGGNAPPSVGTAAPAGRVEVEVYPGAFGTTKGLAASLGLVAAFEKTFGLSIDNIPGSAAAAPIDQGHYAIGARYRAVFGDHSFAAGLSYWRRHYIADRTALAAPTVLDAPDVDYSAIAPGATLRLGATPKIGVFFVVDVPLMLSAGPIQTDQSYGPADVIAFEAEGGVDVVLGTNYGLRLAAEVSQVGLAFSQKAGTMASARGVTNATDRIIGLAATLAITY